MDSVINFISTSLQIPYIEEEAAVMDGSFCLSPYMTEGLEGNGEIQSVTNLYAIDLFYRDKRHAVRNATLLWKMMNAEKNYCCDSPTYVLEQAAGLWRASLRAQEVIE